MRAWADFILQNSRFLLTTTGLVLLPGLSDAQPLPRERIANALPKLDVSSTKSSQPTRCQACPLPSSMMTRSSIGRALVFVKKVNLILSVPTRYSKSRPSRNLSPRPWRGDAGG